MGCPRGGGEEGEKIREESKEGEEENDWSPYRVSIKRDILAPSTHNSCPGEKKRRLVSKGGKKKKRHNDP